MRTEMLITQSFVEKLDNYIKGGVKTPPLLGLNKWPQTPTPCRES